MKNVPMEFFCYHRDRPGSAALRDELLEQHWSYMDGYEKELIARGPTFTGDGIPTGSVHIVDLPDAAAARAFAFDEPNYQAGVYRDVLLRRWRNMLGRTMWEFPGDRSGDGLHLVLGLGGGKAADLSRPIGTHWSHTARCCPTTVPPGSAPPPWSRRPTPPRRERSFPLAGMCRSRCTTGSSAGGAHELP